MKVKLLIAALMLAELAFVGSFVYTHLTTYNKLNVGFVLNGPFNTTCVGAEYWRDTHSIDAYFGFDCKR